MVVRAGPMREMAARSAAKAITVGTKAKKARRRPVVGPGRELGRVLLQAAMSIKTRADIPVAQVLSVYTGTACNERLLTKT